MEAAERLAAGYADPANGPDIAAALWWGRKGAVSCAGCTVSKEVRDDPDRFVAELAPGQRRLTRCNYLVGVMSMVSAELKYPKLGRLHQVGGDVDLRFLPGLARIEVKQAEAREYALLGWVDGDTLGDRWRPEVHPCLRKDLERCRQPRIGALSAAQRATGGYESGREVFVYGQFRVNMRSQCRAVCLIRCTVNAMSTRN